mgnify:CR=1 FL=1
MRKFSVAEALRRGADTLVTMGGVDKDNATGQVLAALQSCNLPADLRVTVVLGPHAPWLAQVQAQAAVGSPGQWDAEAALRAAMRSTRLRILTQFNAMPQGVKFLVDLRVARLQLDDTLDRKSVV